MASFVLFIVFVISIRILELIISKRNEKWLILNGATEYGKSHYAFMLTLHTSFLISLICEYALIPNKSFNLIYLLVFLFLIFAKSIVIYNLGKHWNTKIYIVKNRPLIKRGVYKYIKHPNYLIVIAEIAVIPLVYDLYYTSIVFSFLNLCMLYVRIKSENRALGNASN